MTRTRNLVLAGLLSAGLALTTVPADAKPHRPDVLHLPDGWQPEGIATIGHTAYVGSLVDGDIYALDLRTGAGRVASPGPGTPSVGLEAADGLLWVAGGPTGGGRLVDPRSGAIVRSWTFTTNPSFVNDVVVTGDAAWFTDSQQAQLYRVSLDDGSVTTLPLGGAWQQVSGFNANGIETTPDGSALLVVNSTSGVLYRVDPATGAATVVTGGLTAGDGMLRQGRTLYVVRNQLEQVAVLRLSGDGTAATLARTITSPDFQVPSTVARWGHRLYLPNAQFGLADPTFEVVGVNAR